MESVKCLFCNNESKEVFWQENGYIGRKCHNCNLIYVSPRPEEKEMALLYKIGKAGGVSTKEHINYSYGKELIAKHALSIIKKYKTRGNILEVGSGGDNF
ncbi:TPA: hypothetical protein ENX78_14340 [Candidatus Poribacteria bacterium]|nr:hypothetical protein [Candidatus Poribacteria bacterium]